MHSWYLKTEHSKTHFLILSKHGSVFRWSHDHQATKIILNLKKMIRYSDEIKMHEELLGGDYMYGDPLLPVMQTALYL